MKRPETAIVKLPEIAPEGVRTLLDFFVRRFPQIAPDVWRRRFDEGKVLCPAGPLAADASYQPLLEISYLREVEREWPVRSDYRVAHEDADLLVIDKPPFLPVTPGGHYLGNCLLSLLMKATANEELAPLHRLDRETSGLIIFSKRERSRSHYSKLFRDEMDSKWQRRWLKRAQEVGATGSATILVASGATESRDAERERRGEAAWTNEAWEFLAGARHFLYKEYCAVCDLVAEPPAARARLAHYLAPMKSIYSNEPAPENLPPNSFCEIEMIERAGERGLFRICPITGRRHQIRIQMARAGFPIVNDRIYGLHPRYDPDDISAPLLLNCQRLEIRDFPAYDRAGKLNFSWHSAYRLDPLQAELVQS
ncbi:MAG: pseudouridine synthase [Candidatus Sumerlaeota bacterium]|nr:pseudouridine synthase [Candidatus Sumerlaeota bacterium]